MNCECPPFVASSRMLALLFASSLAAVAHAYDGTKPVLKSVNVTGKVNAQKYGQNFVVEITASDAGSRVSSYYVVLQSPSGRHDVQRGLTLPAPQTNVDNRLSMGSPLFSDLSFDKYSEPGIWQLSYVDVVDANGNRAYYYADALRALGSTTVEVTNAGGYDVVAPSLVSGTLSASSLSLSASVPDTRTFIPVFFWTDLVIKDTGNGVVSGIQWAYVSMCRAVNSCIDMIGFADKVEQKQAVLRVGTNYYASGPGVYKIYSITLTDGASNQTTLQGPELGGTTDFSKLFPTTTLTLTP